MGPFQSRNIQLYRERDESYILNPQKDLSMTPTRLSCIFIPWISQVDSKVRRVAHLIVT